MSGVCICETDADGHCPSCRRIMSEGLKAVGDLMKEYQDKMEVAVKLFSADGRCDECARRYADWAMAGYFKTLADADVPKEVVDAGFKSLTRLLMGLGVTAFPLTLKAYKEICWGKGWNDSDLFH